MTRWVTTLRNQYPVLDAWTECDAFPRRSASETVCWANKKQFQLSVSGSPCQNLASSDRPPNNGQIGPAMSVRSWSLSAGTDGYFLLPESASIGDVESRACVAICPVTALRQRIVRIEQVVPPPGRTSVDSEANRLSVVCCRRYRRKCRSDGVLGLRRLTL